MDKRISDLQTEIDNEVNLLKSRLLKNVSNKTKYINRDRPRFNQTNQTGTNLIYINTSILILNGDRP